MTEEGDSIQVLHVDDDRNLADLVAAFLAQENERISVRTATSPDEGLQILHGESIDCIVSDYEMPSTNGLEFLQSVRQRHPDLPFILFTGKGSEEIASQAISEGVTDYLQKGGTETYTLLANRITSAVREAKTQKFETAVKQEPLTLLERISDAFIVLNTDWEFTFVNEAAEAVFDLPASDLIGEVIWDRFPEAVDTPFFEHYHQAMADGNPRTIEEYFEPWDRWYREHLYPSEDGLSVLLQDITEQKEREQELAQTRERMQLALERTNSIIFEIDFDANEVIRNGAYEQFFDLAPGEVPTWKEHISQAVHPDDREAFQQFYQQVSDGVREGGEIEYRTNPKRGEVHWIRDEVHIIDTDEEEPRRALGIARDITEHKHIESELRQERNLVESIVETSPVGIVVVDADGELSFVNEHAEEIYGRTREELNEFSYDDSRWDIVNEDGEQFEAGNIPFEQVVAREKPVYDQVLGLRRPSGKRIWMSVNGAPRWTETGEMDGAIFAIEDITEQRELEAELEEIFGRVTDAFYALDAEFRFTHVNDRAAELLQASEDELLGERLWDQYPDAAEIDEVWDAFHMAMETQEPQSYDLYFDPLEFWVEATVYPSESGVSVYFRDSTERKERERKIERREQSLRRAYEIIADHDRSVAEQIEALLAVGRELLGTDYATFSHIDAEQYEFEAVAVAPGIDLEPGDTTDLVELPICERVFRTEQRQVITDVVEEAPELISPVWDIKCYLGTPVVVDDATYGTFCFYERESRPEGFTEWEITFVELLSDWIGSELSRELATNRLQRQNDRLDEFVSVVSHDLRNPLSVAEGRLRLAQSECDSAHLDEIEQAHRRMEVLIDDLLVLAREGESVTGNTPISLQQIAQDCWTNVQTANATVNIDVDRMILGDESRLKQLFENLLRNAVTHGGDDVTVTIGELEDGFYVEDDGPGVSEVASESIFEAGYSSATDGTGFGLSIVKQIVEAYDWEIRVTESPGGGARFEITGVEFSDDRPQ
ncbi:hypothetical protein Harman_23530 [Haloarcula mannanilytica]|uniref:histidine kinase n=1 Tax=Haloarcula mannanilytica TaxID=2509225 RepID=A0A4C2EIU4_9EURY|nr:PAS domain S-box protein [Haloarcula mannanilytica]GCF14418.1 hypothetical protein Harman_23530 [Haloarcula mannanilytica]